MNNYRSRLINFTEVLFPAYRKGEKLEYYDASRKTWWQVDDLDDDVCFRHYLCADDQSDEFWDLRIAPKPEPKMPDAPVFWVREKGDPTHMMLVVEIAGSKFLHLNRDRNQPHNIDDLVGFCHWSPDRKNWFDFYGRAVS